MTAIGPIETDEWSPVQEIVMHRISWKDGDFETGSYIG